MKTFFKIFTGLLFFGQSATAICQGNPLGNLFAGNGTTGNEVLLKWVLPGFGSPEGFQVYRQQDGDTEWQLLNPAPVKKMATLGTAEKDDAMTYLEDYIAKNDLTKADPFTLLLLSRKLVELDAFAEYLGLFYRDETVQPGKTYRYKVTQKRGSNEQLVGISNSIAAKPFKPIEPPQGIKVYQDGKLDTVVNVFWTPEETRYFAVNIYRALKGEESKKINEVPAIPTKSANAAGELAYPGLFYDNGDHEVGKKYIYELKGIDFFGRESLVSPPFEIEIIDRSAPPPPTALETVRTSAREVRVTWAESGAKNLVGYDVFVGDSLKAEFVKANETMLPASQTTFTYQIKDERWGDRFFYVEAVNALGARTASTKMGLAMEDVIPPAVPTGVVAKPFEGAIEISWDKVDEPDLMGYVVYRSVANAPGAPFTIVSGGAIDTTAHLDSLPREARNQYYYKVAAVDVYGNLSERSETVSATMPDVIAPISPTIKKIEIKGDTALIAWLPSIDDELKGYHLFRCTEADTTQWLLIGGEMLSPQTTQFTDTGLQPNTNYCYQITAEDLTGNYSAPSNRYTVLTRPGHGQDLVAGKLKATYAKKKKAAVITWQPATATAVQGSILYRREGNSRFLPLTELMSKEAEFIDPNIEPEKSYFYQLRTYYADGNMTLSEAVEVVAK